MENRPFDSIGPGRSNQTLNVKLHTYTVSIYMEMEHA